MMSDERFFAQVKSTLHGYAPGVADGVYEGMRRKLWWSNFTKLSASRFNMWYMLLLIAAGGGASAFYFGGSALAEKPVASNTTELIIKNASTVNAQVYDASAKHCEETSVGQSCCSMSKPKLNYTSCSEAGPLNSTTLELPVNAFENNVNAAGIDNIAELPVLPTENLIVINTETVQLNQEVISEAPKVKQRGKNPLFVNFPKTKETAK